MNTERILELADMLDAHAEAVAKLEDLSPDMGFNMTTWGEKRRGDVYGHTCGTAACIAGWTAAAFGYAGRAKKFDPKRAEGLAEHCHTNGGVIETMGRVLGLNEDMALKLFVPDGVWDNDKKLWLLSYDEFASITPREAAVCLRNLAATGEVDWTHVRERYAAQRKEAA